ncbi:hypothetical protein WSM22_43730 [Cytophagales bacterium WSM2-2]|nr:hypothetical protein WSM22_43730 [Cytophagales bacterium WSM2-2]
MSKEYMSIVEHYEACFNKFGDNHKGVDWPNKADALKRYAVMLDVCSKKTTPVTLLDFGCGTGHLLEYISDNKIIGFDYSGLDVSQVFIDACKKKFPDNKFYCLDILEPAVALPNHDYVVMNGVFTEKRELTFSQMLNYFKKMILAVYAKANNGIAFNVMTKHVDWERDDLFHLPFDTLAEFLTAQVTRNFVIRNNYGLYEYAVYVYK